MSHFQKLNQALTTLDRNIFKFPVGAVSLDDLKPIEEKIKTTRESLKRISSRILMLKAKNETSFLDSEDIPTKEPENTLHRLHEATAKNIINKEVLKLSLYSIAIQEIFDENGDIDKRKKLLSCMKTIFKLNDMIMLLQESIDKAFGVQLELKIQCEKAIFDYYAFLKEQKEQQKLKLQETNPDIAKNKEKLFRVVQKINTTKRLITNFIAASGKLLRKKSQFVKFLEEHRKLIDVETIIKMSQNGPEEVE